MKKLFSGIFLVFVLLSMLAPSTRAFTYLGADNDSYALEYCRYYKTRAHVAARKERKAGVKKAKKYRKSTRLWAQYNACLKENGWPTPYRP